MTAERDIAGFALPFAAGISLAACLPAMHSLPPILFLFPASACILALIHPRHRRFADGTILALTTFMLFCCGAFVSLSHEHLSISTISNGGTISDYASGFVSKIQELIDGLPFKDEENKALLSALITGERSGLNPETTEAFRNSGAAHILALSGLHLGIIYGILKAILSIFGNSFRSRIWKAALIVAACGFYTLATGASPSIVRAFLFILLVETARLTGRFSSTGTILLTSFFIQMALDPSAIKSAGFQLSYAAMAGIAYIYPYFKRMWPEKSEHEGITRKSLRWMWNSVAVSIACQITTGPIAYFYFGTFPQYFLLTNLIALPLVGIVIPLGLLTICLEACGISSSLLSEITEMLLSAMTESLSTIASL